MFLNLKKNEEDVDRQKNIWFQAFKNEAFIYNLMFLSMLDDLLELEDTFERNRHNYCLVYSNLGSPLRKFKLQIVDFNPPKMSRID